MDKAYFKEYYINERKHWWFLARQKILESQVKLVSQQREKLKILNVGIATGATTEMLSNYGEVTSIEFDEDCCRFVREELNIDVIHGSVLDIPFDENSFDLVCAFDVIEHVEDDKLAVKEMQRVCNAGGHVFVTVPAFMALWSDHDLINHHFRRYAKKQLVGLFKPNEHIVYATYFNFFLFPLVYILRQLSKLTKKEEASPKSDFDKFKPGLLNNMLQAIFSMERPWLKNRIKLPFGVSIMLIWKK